MGYVLFGHGGIHLEPGFIHPEMGTVAIPQGTTLQVYSDAGQTLVYGAGSLDIWERLQAPWGPLDSSQVTYNLVLENSEESWQEELAHHPRFGGHELIRAGRRGVPDPIRLCDGTPDTCPTRPEQVAEGATHQCDGILGNFHGDLYWLACTSFVGLRGENRASVYAALEGHTRSVPMGTDPDYVPTETDQRTIAQINGATIRNARTDDSIPFMLGGFAFLIGEDHGVQHYLYAKFQGLDSFTGTVTVHTDASGVADSLIVSGVPPYKQEIVRASVSLFGAMEVVFA
ncbi:hypothetical protein ACWC4D_29830 [Streptomyces sp. NPDC001288]|uniref:hypothetical protein n=1 Tax=Streptomyces sp. NPDC001297 TaxID=3364559 RepID=UPI00369E6485